MPIAVDIVTQEKIVFSEPAADMVLIPAAEGQMGVLPNHAPLLTTLGFGELVIRKGRSEERFAIYGGVVDVRPDKVVVLADLAESSFDIDEVAMEAARASAEKMMREGVPGEQNRDAAAALRRAELALRLVRRVRTSGGTQMRIVEDDEPAK
ncbi:MAG: ATP synthase F1 subunit epsilon [Chloroflexota bacterium]|nr:ATP synthase F1 subunit epsilon [Chloroflexota bacterium]